jgi:hypothetical protein
MQEWSSSQGPCRGITGQRECHGRMPEVFVRNDVGISIAYTHHMLTINRSYWLDAL